MLSLVLTVAIGSGLGAALGYYGQCSSGTCPLTSTWWRGAIYGAVLGLVFHFASGRTGAAEQATKNLRLLKEADFEAEVLRSPVPVIVDFYATWCGPCRKLSPMLDKLAGPLSDKLKFVKINLDETAQLAQQFQVETVPTLLFFNNGKVVDSIVGLPSSDELKTRLEGLARGSTAGQLEATSNH